MQGNQEICVKTLKTLFEVFFVCCFQYSKKQSLYLFVHIGDIEVPFPYYDYNYYRDEYF